VRAPITASIAATLFFVTLRCEANDPPVVLKPFRPPAHKDSTQHTTKKEVPAATESRELDESIDENKVYSLKKPIRIFKPTSSKTYADRERLPADSLVRILESPTYDDLCNQKLCSKHSQDLVASAGKKCEALSDEELAKPACDGHAMVVTKLKEQEPNCFCTRNQDIALSNLNLLMIAKAQQAGDPPRAESLIDGNDIQYKILDAKGKVIYDGYLNAETLRLRGDPEKIKAFETFKARYGFKDGFLNYSVSSKKSYGKMPNLHLYSNGTEVPFDVYTSWSNISIRGSISGSTPLAVTPEKPVEKKVVPEPPSITHEKKEVPQPPATTHNKKEVVKEPVIPPKPPIPEPPRTKTLPEDTSVNSVARSEYVKNLKSAMKAVVGKLTHSESDTVRASIGKGTFDEAFKLKTTNEGTKSADEKGLCWRYVALGLHKTFDIGEPYLPARVIEKITTNEAKNAARLLTRLKNKCGNPLYIEKKIPEVYLGRSRNQLLIKKSRPECPFETFVKENMIAGDILVWTNTEHAGHIEAYLPEDGQAFENQFFYSDYRGNLNQEDGDPNRPGGRSTNTLKTILRYNPC
jgi:hypothetical protein